MDTHKRRSLGGTIETTGGLTFGAALVFGSHSFALAATDTDAEKHKKHHASTSVTQGREIQEHEKLEVIGQWQRSPKFTAPLLDTPKSITVISRQLLDETASNTLADALRNVPGITMGAGEGGNPVGDRPFLRGYDSQSSTFVDGLRDVGAQSRETFNVESVDVIKGDSGAISGRAGAGGSVIINSKMPKLKNAIDAGLGFGNADYKRGTFDGNWRISDTGAFRLNLMGDDEDKAGRGPAHFRRYGVAPSLSFGLGTPNRITLMYYRMQNSDVPDVGIPYNNPAFVARTNGAPRVMATGSGAPINVPFDTWYGLTNRDSNNDSIDMGTLRLEHDFSANLHLRNTTRYSETRQNDRWTMPDDSNGNIYYGYVYRRLNSRISTFDTATNQTDFYGTFHLFGFRNQFSTGTEFTREQGKNDNYTAYVNGVSVTTGTNFTRCATALAFSSHTCTSILNPNASDLWTGDVRPTGNPNSTRFDTKAVYLTDTITFLPQLQANFGVRLDNVQSTYRARAGEYGRGDNLFTYQGGLVYKPTANGSIYASYATAAIPPGNSVGQGSDDISLGADRSGNIGSVLKPERDRTIEVGSKWQFLRNRILVTGALFQIDSTNFKITTASGGIANGGSKRTRGFEVGVNGQLTDRWNMTGGYSYLDARLMEAGGSGTASGLMNGRRAPNTPANSLSLWNTYAILPQLKVGAGVYYMSKVYGTDSPTVPKFVPSYWRFDMMANYRVWKHYSLQLNIQNIANKRYFSQAYTTHYATQAAGRTAFVTLNAKF
ncbi:TonB-dependent siderophore receptor [Ameyamaea chiangmaiensis NBRC 103196]|uniref:TonB-dependent siderophore receptor n=1 Tax=Ameyamaea chiangmaiensis TaxID=442969 RepID=A0A850PCQ6_9PROT|nr:TonB-dependent siderophore receptor [Ameyamaea chiangmaiensis]MBS4075262.1 TonB-dependent siderophore receptor [Ameyamaea chiangmaiensis]NVN40429.1 TonB-dependent siderophore receptor [Ameyamaea chiangmaiensis]GBQ66590.1 TonB-dependent siderophore receptor [Ameyamaea chiangmaiensis NBRC 103196]